MRHALRRLTFVVFSTGALACASHRMDGSAPRSDRNVLTQEQLTAQHFENAYDAVAALRANWLVTRGPDSFDTASTSRVWVYLDNNKLGGVEMLRSISIRSLSTIEHLDGLAATARWGLGHGAGAILIATMSAPRAPLE